MTNFLLFQIVFTPMHGVGGVWVKRVFEEFALPPFIIVPEQNDVGCYRIFNVRLVCASTVTSGEGLVGPLPVATRWNFYIAYMLSFVFFFFFCLNAPHLTSIRTQPDPDFPTVAFPNPEEGKGALSLAIRTADLNMAPIVIANDPDSDRLAAAERNQVRFTHPYLL